MAEPRPDLSGRRGLVAAVAAAWRDLRGSMRAQRDADPREAQLLVYAYLACLIGFVTGLPAAREQADAMAEPDAFTAVVATRFFAAVFFAPLALYGLAGLSGLVARLAGAGVTYRDMRLALFWALVVAAPLFVLGGVVTGLTAPSGAGATIRGIAQAVAGLGFAWIWASFMAEAAGTNRVIQIFITVLSVFAAVLATGALLRSI